jgi:hypothetical protein
MRAAAFTRVPDDGVVLASGRADAAGHDGAGVDPDAHAEPAVVPDVDRHALNAASLSSIIARAAASAWSAWVSLVTGAPDAASTPSPM